MSSPAPDSVVIDCVQCSRTDWHDASGLCGWCRGAKSLAPPVADPANETPRYSGPYPSRPAHGGYPTRRKEQ